jgi:hypothetical protein
MKAFLTSALAVAIVAVPFPVAAACGSGQIPSYDDIEAVMLTSGYRASDGYHEKLAGITAFRRSAYWVFFWDRFPTVYSQYDLVGSVGTYTLGATLADAKDVLRSDRFFELSNPSHLVTDVSQSVLSVLRCSVVTRLIVYNATEFQDPAVAKLLDDFRALVTNSRKTKGSKTPLDFKQTLLFDP